MPAAAPSLPSRLLLWGGLTENALQPSASNGKDRFHYLLLQSLQISFRKGLEDFQQLEHVGFCFLHQCCFLSFLRLHVQGSPLCCSPCLVLQMRILLFGSFAYNFFIHPVGVDISTEPTCNQARMQTRWEERGQTTYEYTHSATTGTLERDGALLCSRRRPLCNEE